VNHLPVTRSCDEGMVFSERQGCDLPASIAECAPPTTKTITNDDTTTTPTTTGLWYILLLP
jgi:hypothetical protein